MPLHYVRSGSPSRRMKAVPQMLPDSSYAHLCSHEFLWPRRAADGHYYQICLLCGAKYKYDWKRMQRIGRMDTDHGTNSVSGSSSLSAHLKAVPRLRLLLELEPAHRVFFRNLADVLLFRSMPPVAEKQCIAGSCTAEEEARVRTSGRDPGGARTHTENHPATRH